MADSGGPAPRSATPPPASPRPGPARSPMEHNGGKARPRLPPAPPPPSAPCVQTQKTRRAREGDSLPRPPPKSRRAGGARGHGGAGGRSTGNGTGRAACTPRRARHPAPSRPQRWHARTAGPPRQPYTSPVPAGRAADTAGSRETSPGGAWHGAASSRRESQA